jgi:hypothetical protein
MIFLNPAVLFGLLAAGIPVLIHLLNLRKLKRIDFSTLAFLKELQKNKIRKLKLKQWLLLALRVMLILLIVMAFARPTLKGVALGGTTSAAKSTAVFIFDDTFSMSVVTPEGSYFNQAKRIADNLINNLQESDEAALVLVSGNDEEITTTQDLGNLSQRIKELQLSQASGTLDKAIIKAAQVLGQSKNFNKELYIISDYQKGRLTGSDDISDLSALLNENVKVYAFTLPGKEIINISIDRLELNTTIFEKEKPVSFNITLTNNSETPVTNAVLSLFINGNRSAQQSVNLKGLESLTITIESPVNADGFIEVSAEIEEDDISADNKRSLSFNIPDKISVGLFASDLNDLDFIETALSAYSSESKLILKKYNLSQFSSLNPEQFSAILICGGGQFNGAERLKSYTENGGGLILIPGEKITPDAFNSLLNSLALSPVEGASGSINRVANPSRFEVINFDHPLFQDIFRLDEKKQLESPDIHYSFNLKKVGAASTIILLNNGSSFLSEYRTEKGKVLLFNVAPVLSWSNFPIKSIFPTLMNRSIYYLASRTNTENNLITGEELNIYLGRGIQKGISVKMPDNSEEFITIPENSNGYIELKATKSAGIYKFLKEKEIIQQIAVNTDPRESVTEHSDIKVVEEYLNRINFKGRFFVVPANENPSGVILQSRFGSELWKYFLFAALLLAIIEMAVARSAKKDLVPVP